MLTSADPVVLTEVELEPDWRFLASVPIATQPQSKVEVLGIAC